MYIKSKYPFRWKLNYVPTYFENLTEEQEQDQKTVLDFKKGIYDTKTMFWFRQQIWNINKGSEYGWLVCFLPCNSEAETKHRFGKLADYLSKTTRAKIILDMFNFLEERTPSHSGNKYIDIDNIGMKIPNVSIYHIILIDDVITTGTLFNKIAERLIQEEALSVHGLFLAKSVHPDQPKKERKNYEDDWLLQEFLNNEDSN